MTLNLNTFFGGGGSASDWKVVSYVPPAVYSISTNASVPTRITCGANQRLRILLLCEGNIPSTVSSGTSSKYKDIRLGNTVLLNTNQHLSFYRYPVNSTYIWWGSITEESALVSVSGTSSTQVRIPTTFTSSLGCPVGAPGEALSMYATSTTSQYRQIYLSYEILQKI